ncbi:hypothetical protein QFC19_001160 [Naganishia cerealis]|uniref:Uncharacterized protein n=1 Tax=Naganishia cerealis TaxID=610337 RepID=A0ACC2WJW9_9TREE|nr:hypothetical protein QFC19_001160 [Naganishia cerealis]
MDIDQHAEESHPHSGWWSDLFWKDNTCKEATKGFAKYLHYPSGRFRTGMFPALGSQRIFQLNLCPYMQPWEKIPYHPDFPDIQDWDRADTAIDWPYFEREVEYAKKEGKHLPELRSHDHLNKQVEVPIDDSVVEQWRTRFQELEAKEREKGVELIFVLLDGFLLFYDPVSLSGMSPKYVS